MNVIFFFFFQAEDGIRDLIVTGVQTCALPIYPSAGGFENATCWVTLYKTSGRRVEICTWWHALYRQGDCFCRNVRVAGVHFEVKIDAFVDDLRAWNG